MELEEILTNRNRLSDDILQEVDKSAGGYGVAIARADVKDLIFPGNLQEIMNRVLAAERNSQAQLVEARTRAEVARIEAQTKAANQRVEAEASSEARRTAALSEADARRITTEADIRGLREQEQAASAYSRHPALLRLAELDTIRALAAAPDSRIYLSFDKHADCGPGDDERSGAIADGGFE